MEKNENLIEGTKVLVVNSDVAYFKGKVGIICFHIKSKNLIILSFDYGLIKYVFNEKDVIPLTKGSQILYEK